MNKRFLESEYLRRKFFKTSETINGYTAPMKYESEVEEIREPLYKDKKEAEGFLSNFTAYGREDFDLEDRNYIIDLSFSPYHEYPYQGTLRITLIEENGEFATALQRSETSLKAVKQALSEEETSNDASVDPETLDDLKATALD